MKLKIHYQDIQETVEVADAAAGLHRLKQEAARRAPFFLRAVINGMGDLAFAAEGVKRANAANNRNDPAPRSATEFLDWAVVRGYCTIVET